MAMSMRNFCLALSLWLLGSITAALPAVQGGDLARTDSLTITRIIPGPRRVTVEWLEPEVDVKGSDLCYRVSIKFRTALWEDARTTVLRGDETSATLRGLLNNADYAVRPIFNSAIL